MKPHVALRGVPDTGHLRGIRSFPSAGKEQRLPQQLRKQGPDAGGQTAKRAQSRRGNPDAHVTDCRAMQMLCKCRKKKKQLTKCSWRRIVVALKPLKIPVSENTRLRPDLPTTSPEEVRRHCASFPHLPKPGRRHGEGISHPNQLMS